jgi:two-component system, LytTR family, sensor kinase
MTLNEFTFSKETKIRIFRHVTVWLLLYILGICTYPPRGSGSLHGRGVDGFLIFYRMVLIRVFLMLICQMLFSYIFLYILVPFYFRRKKYVLFVILLLATWLVSAVFRFFVYTYIYNPIMLHFQYHINDPKLILLFSIRQTISGPAFIGFIFIALKLTKDWQQKQKEFIDLQKENAAAEIQLLKAQVHPHFLFNTLNNIYSFTINRSPQAGELVQQLYGLLNYMMNECNDPYVSLDKEINILKNYADLEKVRYGSRLYLEWNVDGNPDSRSIAPLLMIPFLENSFKHGTSQILKNPWIKLSLRITDDKLLFSLINGKPNENETFTSKKGLGLVNVKKRLQLIYGSAHALEIENNPENYSVKMEVPLH